MKLRQCYVENFGKLHAFQYDFQDGLNIIFAANGWGKTTLLTFIKAMFYGLSAYKGKKNFDENEREKYWPWQGGNFGGRLDFEVNGGCYRVERYFGKTAAEDTFRLLNLSNHKPSKDFPERLGEALFALDADGFQRTVMIPQKDIEANLSESIIQKLTHLLQGTTENFDMTNAQALLDKERRALSNQQRSGRLDQLKDELQKVTYRLSELKRDVSRTNALSAEIAELNQDCQRLHQELVSLQSKNIAVSETETVVPQKTQTILPWWLIGLLGLAGIVLLVLNFSFFYRVNPGLFGAVWVLTGGCLLGCVIGIIDNWKCRPRSRSVKNITVTSEPTLNITGTMTAQVRAVQTAYQKQQEKRTQTLIQLQRLQEAQTTINDLETQQAQLTAEVTALTEEFQAVVEAKKFLLLASDALNQRFLEPLQQGLQKYLKLISNQNFGNLSMDTNFNLLFNEFGRDYGPEYYSKGYQNIFNLCMRLSLVETLFQKEQPFIVLDDPFVNLDADKITELKKILNQLAQHYQIIYCTCHQARC